MDVLRGTALPGIIDQALWSLTNLIALVAAAHVMGARAFGVLGLVSSVAILLAGLTASCSGEVAAVSNRVSVVAAGEPDLPSVVARGLGITICGCAAAIVTCLSLSLVLGVRGPAVVLLALLGGMLVMAEGVRSLHYALRATWRAMAMSLIWLPVETLFLLIAIWLDILGPVQVIVAWLAGAGASALVGVFLLGARARVGLGNAAEKRRRLIFSLEYLLTAGPTHLMVMGAALGGGPAVAGSLRALQTVFGPLNLMLLGMRNVYLPRAARLTSPSAVRSVGGGVSAVGITVALGATGLLLGLPALGRLLMGGNWVSDPLVLLAFSVGRVAIALTFGAVLVLRALDYTRGSLPLRISTALVTLGGFAVGMMSGLSNALLLSGLGALATGFIWWWIAARISSGPETAL